MACPHCGHDVPAAPFCARCGEPLENRDSPYPHERRGFAAAPGEHQLSPRLISSLFPHLPRRDMASFRAGLATGVCLIVGLSLFDLFPLALIAAAVLVPFLTILYFWDVDLYEDDPVPALAFTILWGALAGVGIGIASRHLASAVSLTPGSPGRHQVLWLGVLLPAAGVVLAVVGPVVLLPYRNFNNVLDGATFGGACAVTLIGAETIANSAGFLRSGVRAAGSTDVWIVRLLTLGIALPVLAACAAGTTCGALWLRYRAPKVDRGKLGLLAAPLFLVPLLASVVAVSVCELYLGAWATLAIASGLGAVGLVSLRRVIHLGLVEESAEREVGPPQTCANCGRATAVHSFCTECGVALRALPKLGRRLEQGAEGEVGLGVARAGARLSHGRALGTIAALLAAATAVTALVIVLARPRPAHPPCKAGQLCGSPPPKLPSGFASKTLASASGPYEAGTSWTASIGVRLRYDSRIWRATNSTGTALLLRAQNNKGQYVLAAFVAVPAGVGPEQLLEDQLSAERGGYLGLETDKDPAHELLGPEIGLAPGVGAMYTGTSDAPPSPSERVELAFEVATSGGATVLVEAVTDTSPEGRSSGSSSPFPVFSLVSEIVDTLEWPQT